MKNQKYDSNFSSLKYFNFDGWKPEKIIEKYENVLSSREKQITDLSVELGTINNRITVLSENIKSLKEENELLKNRMQKRVIIIYLFLG